MSYINNVITEQIENNFSLVDDDNFIWYDDFPFKQGDIFPPPKIQEVANISLTNRNLYENRMEEVLNSVISLFPDNKIFQGFQLKEIIQSLPLFSGIVNDFIGLMAANGVTIDVDCANSAVDDFLESSNLNEIILQEIISLFIDPNSAYIVSNIDNLPFISKISSKNIIPFSNSKIPSLLETLCIFSIYKHIKYGEVVEFNIFKRNGEQEQKTFIYRKGKLGNHLKELDSHGTSYEGFNFSNVVYFSHNSTSGSLIGNDIISSWAPSISALCRSLQTLYRAGDEHRERLTYVPEESIQKDGLGIGFLSGFFNKGVIAFGKNKISQEPKFITPELQVEQLERLVIQARKEIAVDSRISSVFLDIENVGGGLTSGKALKTILTPTILRAKLYQQQLIPGLKELIIKVAASGGYDLSNSKINIKFNETINEDLEIITESICKQYEKGLISLEDAILKLNVGISSKQAKIKARELKGLLYEEEIKKEEKSTTEESIELTVGESQKLEEVYSGYNEDLDSSKWENEVVAVDSIT